MMDVEIVELRNTIRFDFGDGCAKPNLAEMADFVKSLDADAGEIEAAYRISEEKAVFMKCKSEECMQYVLRNNNMELLFRYADGKVVKVRMSPACGYTQYVRVYGLPPEIPDEILMTEMGKYGTIRRVVREKFPVELGLNMQTGVRGVYMEVKTEIPSSLRFGGRKGNISYDAIKDKCFLCKMDGHKMNSCPKKKSRKQLKKQQQSNTSPTQDEAHTSTTYAAAVAGIPSVDITDKAEEAEEVKQDDQEASALADGDIDETTETGESTGMSVLHRVVSCLQEYQKKQQQEAELQKKQQQEAEGQKKQGKKSGARAKTGFSPPMKKKY